MRADLVEPEQPGLTLASTASDQPTPVTSRLLAPETRSEPYRDIDRHALKAPKEAEQAIDSLAKYLAAPARNDREKTRAIFRWMTDRIAYDVEAYFGKRETDASPEGVLQNRRAVCAGYANLFQELCTSTGIEAVVIDGDAKGFGFVEDGRTENHAWNAVMLDGAWHLLDVTWCAGGVTDEKTFLKDFKETYYLTAPEQMILDHLPADSEWQLLNPPVSAEDFGELLKLKPGLRHFATLHRELVEKLRGQTFRGFVGHIDVGESGYVVRKAPLAKHLRAGGRYAFQIESGAFVAAAVLTGGQYRDLTRKGDLFEGDVRLEKGMVLVCVKLLGQKNDAYWPLLEYVAE
jgi:Transglutaminase-like superfamily